MVKYIVFCALIAVVSCGYLTDEQLKKYKPLGKECQKITGADDEILKKACKGEFVDDPKLKEQILCVSKKSGVLSEDGDIAEDKLKAEINEILKDDAKSEKIVKECAIKRESPIETGFELSKCVTKHLPQRDDN